MAVPVPDARCEALLFRADGEYQCDLPHDHVGLGHQSADAEARWTPVPLWSDADPREVYARGFTAGAASGWSLAEVGETEGIVGVIARVINPDPFADDAADYIDDLPFEQATARMQAARVAAWLEQHDRETARSAVASYQLLAGQALLALLPGNPHAKDR